MLPSNRGNACTHTQMNTHTSYWLILFYFSTMIKSRYIFRLSIVWLLVQKNLNPDGTE